jgi:hypothetical protein
LDDRFCWLSFTATLLRFDLKERKQFQTNCSEKVIELRQVEYWASLACFRPSLIWFVINGSHDAIVRPHSERI